jgi:hypothetical protein
MLKFVPFSVKMVSNGYVRDASASSWCPLSEQWVMRGETVADKKARAHARAATNVRADRVICVLTRFIAHWTFVRRLRIRHANRAWRALRGRQARAWRYSVSSDSECECESECADPVVKSWMIVGSWAAHEEGVDAAKRGAAERETEAILGMSASAWKACWLSRIEECKVTRKDVRDVIAWSRRMDALRESRRVAEEVLRAPKTYYVGSVCIGKF